MKSFQYDSLFLFSLLFSLTPLSPPATQLIKVPCQFPSARDKKSKQCSHKEIKKKIFFFK